ncbi:hypothetical protein Mapa_003210 [Marchantia paleacea]|nr:hypothetical protein Mapa_003210 [Marchantia paleacea]
MVVVVVMLYIHILQTSLKPRHGVIWAAGESRGGYFHRRLSGRLQIGHFQGLNVIEQRRLLHQTELRCVPLERPRVHGRAARVHLLVSVADGGEDIQNQVHRSHGCQQPVVVVQMAPVQIIGMDPPTVARDMVDESRQQRVEEHCHSEIGHVQCRAQRSHAVGRLVVEEFELPHGRENLPQSLENVLREKPENRQRHMLVRRVQQPGALGHLEPLHLHQGGGHHG